MSRNNILEFMLIHNCRIGLKISFFYYIFRFILLSRYIYFFPNKITIELKNKMLNIKNLKFKYTM